MEKASGVRQITCPWQAMRSPFVIAVVQAYRWYKAEQLGVRWPDPPEALMRGLEVYDAAVQRVIAHDFDEKRKREKEDEKLRDATFGLAPSGRQRVLRR